MLLERVLVRVAIYLAVNFCHLDRIARIVDTWLALTINKLNGLLFELQLFLFFSFHDKRSNEIPVRRDDGTNRCGLGLGIPFIEILIGFVACLYLSRMRLYLPRTNLPRPIITNERASATIIDRQLHFGL